MDVHIIMVICIITNSCELHVIHKSDFDSCALCLDASNEESNCLRQLETIKEDFVKTVAVSDLSLNATTNTTTDAGGILSAHDKTMLCYSL